MIKKIYTILCALSLFLTLLALGMENDIADHNATTYPCDLCLQEKSLLNYTEMQRDGIDCLHIFCQNCQETINTSWRKPIEDKVWWSCDYCSYFFNQKNKQCWQISQKKGFSLAIHGALGLQAQHFKKKYPDRIVSDITDTTLFHSDTQMPDRTLLWLSAASVAAIACCITYITLNNL